MKKIAVAVFSFAFALSMIGGANARGHSGHGGHHRGSTTVSAPGK